MLHFREKEEAIKGWEREEDREGEIRLPGKRKGQRRLSKNGKKPVGRKRSGRTLVGNPPLKFGVNAMHQRTHLFREFHNAAIAAISAHTFQTIRVFVAKTAESGCQTALCHTKNAALSVLTSFEDLLTLSLSANFVGEEMKL